MRLRRPIAGLVAALLATAPAAGLAKPEAKPHRIMSTNMCSDLLLLMLVPKARISSITYLAHDAVAVLMPGADAGVRINYGTAEEVVREKPDLILASPWSATAMRRLAAKVGVPVADIESANSFADIRRIVRQTGALVGEPARAEALIARMDRTLADLAASRPRRTVRLIAWSDAGSVPGKGTLTDEIIRLAGGENIAAKYDDERYSSFDLEELLRARPDALLHGEDRYDGPSIRDSRAAHPIIRKAFAGRQISYPASLYACGLPQSADAARDLRGALAKLPAGGVPW